MAAAMPWKILPSSITKVTAKAKIASQKVPITIYGCIVESHESAWRRVESSLRSKHEDRIAGKGFASMTHCSLVHKFMAYASSDENSRCKSRSGQGLEKARDDHSMATGEHQEQEGSYSGSTKRQKEGKFATLMDMGHLKNAELERKIQKYRGRVVLRENIAKDGFGAYAVFSE